MGTTLLKKVWDLHTVGRLPTGLWHSFSLDAEADAIEHAVAAVLEAGARTVDLLDRPGGRSVAGSAMARMVADALGS